MSSRLEGNGFCSPITLRAFDKIKPVVQGRQYISGVSFFCFESFWGCCITCTGAWLLVAGVAAWLASTGENARYIATSMSTMNGNVQRMILLNMSFPFPFGTEQQRYTQHTLRAQKDSSIYPYHGNLILCHGKTCCSSTRKLCITN